MKTKLLFLLILISAVGYLLYIERYTVALGLFMGSITVYFIVTVLKSTKATSKQIGDYNGWPL